MEREQFLNRLSLALGRARPRAVTPGVAGVPEDYRLRPFGPEMIGLSDLDAFERATVQLGAQCVVPGNRLEAATALRALLDELQPKTVITWDRAEYDVWPLAWLWDERGAVATGGRTAGNGSPDNYRETSLRADVGITLADCAVANTGTLMLTSSSGRPRSVSLLPAVHIALIDESQIVPRLGLALERLTADNAPSSVNFISGPSRSGDIEGDLSVGVHGPAAVHVIVARLSPSH